MIKVIENNYTAKKQKPYYDLVFNYMIGDANGHTEESMGCSIEDAEIIERFVKLINGLKPLSGTWGIVLDSYDFVGFLNEGQLNQEDYNFLKTVMFYTDEPADEDDDINGYFAECIQGETEYSFLVFQGVDLFYYDENGVKHATEIVTE
jgi:hypothetical protein